MHAAVVRSFDQPPHYEAFANPVATGADEVVVQVLAAALHPRVRSAADGSHYESDGTLPTIPGIDGVGRTPDGETIYFVLPDTHLGSLAEQVVVDRRRCAVLPAEVDAVAVAAAMNPAMSSWIALRRRVAFVPGQNVLVLGATGNAGRMAVQVARRLGAGRIVAAGRDAARLASLPALGADVTVGLADEAVAADRALGEACDAAEVDVVIDYLWGAATQRALPAVLAARSDRGRPLTWIQVGSMAGLELTLPSAWLRAARLDLVGSGQGSVPTRDIAGELPALAAELMAGDYAIDARATPLAEVTRAWTATPAGTERTVFVPQPPQSRA